MRTYHCKSWSTQARKMCDSQINLINGGWQTIDSAIYFFSTSYRPEIITYRAAKRFGRIIRANKVKEMK